VPAHLFGAFWLNACFFGAGPAEPPSLDFWSFRPVERPAPPEVRNAAWPRTSIDRFILAKLESGGLAPAPEATRAELIRRATFDLTGLPPTPEEVAAFEDDGSPDAYDRLVDRLLSSPRHGERWARHWLDVVRFAESEGFEYDNHLAGAWRYRDYVIRSFNEDKPYDRFVMDQLAGDEIDPANEEAQVAAGFHRLGAVRRNAGNQEVAGSRNEVLTERTDIIGLAFLGLTVGCARCHDHKFDPIPQKDYYRLQAFLAATQEHDISLAPKAVVEAWKLKTGEAQKEVDRLTKELARAEGERKAELQRQLDQAEARLPPAPPAIAGICDSEAERTPIHVLQRGEWEKKGERVGMRLPGVIASGGAAELPAATPRSRTILARGIASPKNPLTARVIVNRLWQHHFGRGLVATPNDFGMNGERPSHPRLLDHLAAELMDGGWRLKPLHRLILLSSAYRQSSRFPAAAPGRTKDPEDRLLWRFRRRRLEAEEIRDAMLSISGTLNRKAGGESVMVPVGEDLVRLLYKPYQWAVSADAAEHHRRSIYLFAKRNLQLPLLEAFDQPTLQTSAPLRASSTHVPQALELLSGGFSNDLAQRLAGRLLREAGPGAAAQIDLAYRLAAGRPPSEVEARLALSFLEKGSLSEFSLAMFSLNSFLYLD
jgi:hypothetical protein